MLQKAVNTNPDANGAYYLNNAEYNQSDPDVQFYAQVCQASYATDNSTYIKSTFENNDTTKVIYETIDTPYTNLRIYVPYNKDTNSTNLTLIAFAGTTVSWNDYARVRDILLNGKSPHQIL